MAKKHCEKHSRYVYKCRDCRIANGEEVPDSKTKKKMPESNRNMKYDRGEDEDYEDSSTRLYRDVDLDSIDENEDFEIPVKNITRKKTSPTGGRGGPGGPRKPPSGGSRFRYNKPITKKTKIQLIGLLIFIAVIVLIVGIYVIPTWHAGISLQQQLYDFKAGGLDFWEFYILDWWSTSFIINKVGLIGALIGSILMSIPPEKDFFNAIAIKLGRAKVGLKKSMIIWWTAGFVFFYLIGQLINGFNDNFSFAMYMVQNGTIGFNFSDIFLPFRYLAGATDLTPEQDLTTIYLYNNVVSPIITFIVVVVIIRLILNIIGISLIDRNDYKIIGNIGFIISAIFISSFAAIPKSAYDALGLIQIWSRFIGIFAFLGLGIFMYVWSRRVQTPTIPQYEVKKVIIAGAIVIGITIIPLLISIPTSITINSSTYEVDRWEAQIARQREWTIATAGLDMFETQDMDDLVNDDSSNIITSIRQYDKESAMFRMNKIIQTSFETVGDSDIVFVDDTEYWIAPKTIDVSIFSGADSDILKHTNAYDHVEGFVAIDVNTGEEIDSADYESLFGVSNNYSIFFGEHESSTLDSSSSGIYDDEYEFLLFDDYGAYDDDILLNTQFVPSAVSFNDTYSGAPDGSLTGLEAFWYTSNMGLFSYAINSSLEKEFLINRNIEKRVSSILLPGLWIDEDPYLVFDTDEGKVYYAVSICTNLAIDGYASSEIFRFLGIALVDVLDGSLQFVENPAWEDITSADQDPVFNLLKIYRNSYNWGSVDDAEYDWLKEQLRYPEQLFETQLYYDYYYHVDDPITWFGGAEFYTRPEGGDLFYVEFDLGEGQGIEFVGIDLVQKLGNSDVTTLTGMYVLRHGDNFGKCIFYDAELSEDPMIGPEAARNSFKADATNALFSITNKDYGNTLLYPLAGSLYYVVPVYSEDGGFQTVKQVGLVNAFDIGEVVYGADIQAAFDMLNYTKSETFDEGNVTLTYEFTDSTNFDYKILDVNIVLTDENFTAPARNAILNISVQTNAINITNYVNGVPQLLDNSTFEYDEGKIGYNYTLIDQSLSPGQGITLRFKIDTTVGDIAKYIPVDYQFVLIVDGEVTEFELDEIFVYI